MSFACSLFFAWQLSETLSSSDNENCDGEHNINDAVHLDELIHASTDSTPVCSFVLFTLAFSLPTASICHIYSY